MVKDSLKIKFTEKNAYENPRMEIVRFQPVDIITMSGNNNETNESEWTGFY